MKAKLERHYPALLAFLIGRFGAPDCTPEHNKLQNRFLEEEFALKFALAASPRVQEVREILGRFDLARSWGVHAQSMLERGKERAERMPGTLRERALGEALDRIEALAKTLVFHPGTGTLEGTIWKKPVVVSRLQFEQDGADVAFRIDCSCGIAATSVVGAAPASTAEDNELFGYSEMDAFSIEVKPLVGDDYPAILRAMKAVKTKQLLVGEYCGESATWGQVKKIFSLSGIVALLLEDVEHTVLPPSFREVRAGLPSPEEAVAIVRDLYDNAGPKSHS